MNEATIEAEGTHAITIVRDFDCSVDKVFLAMSRPELMARWMGPRYLTNIETTSQPRHGGVWTFVQRDSDGSEFRFRGVLHGDPTPELSQRTFEWLGMPGHVSLETMRLEDLGDGRTRAHQVSVFTSAEDRDGMMSSGMHAGVNESFERMDELLEVL